MNNQPFVSVVIPARNEETFIGKCLDSLVANDYPKEKLEILVVDGGSEDKTKGLVQSYVKKYSFIKLLENPKKFTPISMNIGVKNAEGDVVIVGGAHAAYAPNYISKSVRYLEEYGADSVGGVLQTLPAVKTFPAKAIALALSSFFGTGGANFRVGIKKPTWVDTAFGGCLRKEIFQKIGYFNENLIRSQDMDFSIRLKNSGAKILLVPDIVTTYYPKTNFKDFWSHNIKDGIWAILPLKYGAPLFKPRHLIPFVFVISLLLSVVLGIFIKTFIYLFLFILLLYFAVNGFFSSRIAASEKNFLLFPFLIIAFAIRHFAYGIGSFIGILKMIF